MSVRIFYFYGDDKKKILAEVRAWQSEFNKKYPDAGMNELDASEENLYQAGEILQQALTVNLFGRPQFCVMRGLFALKTEAKEIITYVLERTAPDSSTIVFLEDEEAGKMMAKKFSDQWQVKEFSLPKDKDFEKWLTAEAEKYKFSASEIALLKKVEYKNIPYWQTTLPMFFDMKKHLPLAAILKIYFPPTVPEEMFPFLNAIRDRRIASALQALESFVLDSSTLIWLGGFIVWQANFLRLTYLAKEQKISTAVLAKSLKMKSAFPLDSASRSLLQWTEQEINELNQAGWTLLKRVKETAGEPAAYLHQIIYTFCK